MAAIFATEADNFDPWLRPAVQLGTVTIVSMHTAFDELFRRGAHDVVDYGAGSVPQLWDTSLIPEEALD